MAALEFPITAVDYCQRLIKSMPIDQISIIAQNKVLRILWMAAPWRWSIGTLTAIPLVSGTQDYTLAPPTDFLYLLHGIATTGDQQRHLEVLPSLPTDVKQSGQPLFYSYAGSNTFRFFPKPIVPTSPTTNVLSWYKKTSPIITNQNQHTAGTLVMDDEWFHVFEAGLLWQFYLYGDDSRAGGAQFDGRSIQYTGQRAVFESHIAEMKLREPLPVWNPALVPSQKEANK
jgi:hypothetical protein